MGRAARHVEFGEDPEVETVIRAAIDETYVGLGRYDDTEPHLRIALELEDKIHGGDNADVARTLRNLGVLLYSKGAHVHRTEPASQMWLWQPKPRVSAR